MPLVLLRLTANCLLLALPFTCSALYSLDCVLLGLILSCLPFTQLWVIYPSHTLDLPSGYLI